MPTRDGGRPDARDDRERRDLDSARKSRPDKPDADFVYGWCWHGVLCAPIGTAVKSAVADASAAFSTPRPRTWAGTGAAVTRTSTTPVSSGKTSGTCRMIYRTAAIAFRVEPVSSIALNRYAPAASESP